MTRIPALYALVAALVVACGGGTLGVDAAPDGSSDAVVEVAVDVATPDADPVDPGAPDTPADEHVTPSVTCDQIGKAPADPAMVAPSGVATNGALVFVTDPAGGAILKYTDTLTFVERYQGFDGAMPAGVFEPYGIAVDASKIYVTDTNDGNGRVLKATASGLFEKAWGDGQNGGPDLKTPKAIVLADDTLYVADAADGTVYAFSTSGTLLRTVSQGVLQEPVALVVSGTQLLVADTKAGEIVVLPIDGGEAKRLDLDGGLSEPVGLAVDAGRVFVTDRKSSRLVTGTPDDTLVGWCGGEGAGSGQLSRPRGLAMLSGELFVADYGNKRLVKIHP